MQKKNPKRGKFIVIYGVNNVGKSTQATFLKKRLEEKEVPVAFYKIPQYRVEPAGVMLDEYLRKNNPDGFSPREAQLLYELDRSDFRMKLEGLLSGGTWVIFEDYWATGVMWGVARGVSKKFLLRINAPNIKEDVTLFLKGRRFKDGKEKNHLNEHDDPIIKKVERISSRLAKEFKWKIINANQSIEEVSADIWAEVKKVL